MGVGLLGEDISPPRRPGARIKPRPGSSPKQPVTEPRLDYSGLKNLRGITDKISLLDHDNP